MVLCNSPVTNYLFFFFLFFCWNGTLLDSGEGSAGVSSITSGDISEGLAADVLWGWCFGVLCMNRTLVQL